MSRLKDRFRELGLDFPTIAKPDLPFAPAMRIGNIVYISGQIPEIGEDLPFIGKVGGEIDLERAQKAAAVCAANVLYWLDAEIDGDISRVVQVAKVTVYVNAVEGYAQFSQVGNGASRLFLDVLGPAGMHARAAIGVAGLPLNVPVEVDAVVHIR